jgi:transposase
MRYDEGRLAYVFRRTAKGTSKREITRCLKRYIARQVFRALLNPGTKKHECKESLKVGLFAVSSG